MRPNILNERTRVEHQILLNIMRFTARIMTAKFICKWRGGCWELERNS